MTEPAPGRERRRTGRVLKLTIEYDGTDYVGWQRQPSGVSIQALLEDALAPFEGKPVTVHGAGRTDAGVHALAQVASVSLDASTHDPATLHRALNAVLPADVRVLSVDEAPPEFHARFAASAKIYEYRVVDGPFVSAFLRRYVWHVPPRINHDAVREAAAALAGRHDFAAFQAADGASATTVRTIHEIEWMAGDAYDRPSILRVRGDGFLRHMVRNIAGTLVEIGTGRWPPSAMPGILAGGDRTRAGITAPPTGLFLVAVLY